MATIALLIARTQAPGRHELEVDLFILALGVMALLAAISWLHGVAPPEERSMLEKALDRELPEPPAIPELDRLERAVYVGAARAFDLLTGFAPSFVRSGRPGSRGAGFGSIPPATRCASCSATNCGSSRARIASHQQPARPGAGAAVLNRWSRG